MNLDMRILISKVEMSDSHALVEVQNLASERKIKLFKGLLASQEQKLKNLIFSIINMKEENNIKQKQARKIVNNIRHREILYMR